MTKLGKGWSFRIEALDPDGNREASYYGSQRTVKADSLEHDKLYIALRQTILECVRDGQTPWLF